MFVFTPPVRAPEDECSPCDEDEGAPSRLATWLKTAVEYALVAAVVAAAAAASSSA